MSDPGEVINVRSDLAIMVTVKPNTWLSLEVDVWCEKDLLGVEKSCGKSCHLCPKHPDFPKGFKLDLVEVRSWWS